MKKTIQYHFLLMLAVGSLLIPVANGDSFFKWLLPPPLPPLDMRWLREVDPSVWDLVAQENTEALKELPLETCKRIVSVKDTDLDLELVKRLHIAFIGGLRLDHMDGRLRPARVHFLHVTSEEFGERVDAVFEDRALDPLTLQHIKTRNIAKKAPSIMHEMSLYSPAAFIWLCSVAMRETAIRAPITAAWKPEKVRKKLASIQNMMAPKQKPNVYRTGDLIKTIKWLGKRPPRSAVSETWERLFPYW